MAQHIGAQNNIFIGLLSKCNPWRKEKEQLEKIKSEVNLTIISCAEMRDSIRDVVESNHFSEWLVYESQQGNTYTDK